MMQWHKKRDVLREKFGSDEALRQAREVLLKEEQTEEAFLGAQAVLMMQGLL